MIYNVGINDVPNIKKRNKRAYDLWVGVLQRCYSESYHKKQPSYIGCTVCERWLTLSNFLKDLPKIENYEFWKDNPSKRVALDKDLKGNKHYSLESCTFVSQSTNSKEKSHNRPSGFCGELKPFYAINISSGSKFYFEVQGDCAKQLELDRRKISACLLGNRKTHKGYRFEYA